MIRVGGLAVRSVDILSAAISFRSHCQHQYQINTNNTMSISRLVVSILMGIVIIGVSAVVVYRLRLTPAPSLPRVYRNWEEKRVMEILGRGEQGKAYSNQEFRDIIRIVTDSNVDYNNRINAVACMWFIRREDQKREAAKVLRSLLKDPTFLQDRATIILGLGLNGDTSDIPRVEPYLNDIDPTVRRRAVQAIAYLGGLKYRSVIEQKLSDPAEEVREAAKSILDGWDQKQRRSR